MLRSWTLALAFAVSARTASGQTCGPGVELDACGVCGGEGNTAPDGGGLVQERTRYAAEFVEAVVIADCEHEVQTRTRECSDGGVGAWSDWSGTYSEEACAAQQCESPGVENYEFTGEGGCHWKCAGGYVLVDGACTPCPECKVCPMPDNAAHTSDTGCDWECSDGHYRREVAPQGGAGAGVECALWTVCGNGAYVSSPGSALHDRECAPCMHEGECAGNTFLSPECPDGDPDKDPPRCIDCYIADHDLARFVKDVGCEWECTDGHFASGGTCAEHSSCPAGEYETAAPTGTEDRNCSPCQTECSGHQWPRGTCAQDFNPICTDCPLPDHSTFADPDGCDYECDAGYYRDPTFVPPEPSAYYDDAGEGGYSPFTSDYSWDGACKTVPEYNGAAWRYLIWTVLVPQGLPEPGRLRLGGVQVLDERGAVIAPASISAVDLTPDEVREMQQVHSGEAAMEWFYQSRRSPQLEDDSGCSAYVSEPAQGTMLIMDFGEHLVPRQARYGLMRAANDTEGHDPFATFLLVSNYLTTGDQATSDDIVNMDMFATLPLPEPCEAYGALDTWIKRTPVWLGISDASLNNNGTLEVTFETNAGVVVHYAVVATSPDQEVTVDRVLDASLDPATVPEWHVYASGTLDAPFQVDGPGATIVQTHPLTLTITPDASIGSMAVFAVPATPERSGFRDAVRVTQAQVNVDIEVLAGICVLTVGTSTICAADLPCAKAAWEQHGVCYTTLTVAEMRHFVWSTNSYIVLGEFIPGQGRLCHRSGRNMLCNIEVAPPV